MTDEALRGHLRGRGAIASQFAELDSGAMVSFAGDLVLGGGLDLTLAELADRCGTSVEQARSLYSSAGLDVDRLAGFGPGDVEMLSLTLADESGVIEQVGAELFRVAGRSLRRVAEAAVAAYVQDVESQPDDASGQALVELAELNEMASGLAVAFSEVLGTMFRHHMWIATREQRTGQDGVGPSRLIRAGVGFVDLVGFTPMSQQLDPGDLMELVEGFERRAFDVATRLGGQVVKSIGDEVMLAGPDHETVARVALSLVEGFSGDPDTRPRGGVSAGEVVFRLGDYYGPIVNVASRLVDAAAPGEVLTDLPSAESEFVTGRPAGQRTLKGYVEPIDVWSLAASS